MFALATFASLALAFAAHVHASVYVTNPVQSSQLTAGQAFQVEWVDNGEAPLLSQIGECNVALYTGEYQLVQSLPSVDVSTSSSFSFTPDPAAGVDGQYYIVFISTSTSYTGFSASFSLTGMTGTGGSSTGTSATPSASSSTLSGSSVSASSGSSTSAPSGSITGSSTVSPPTTSVPTSTTSHSSTSTTTTSTTSSTSSTPSSAAARVGSSMSVGGIAALLALSGVLAF